MISRDYLVIKASLETALKVLRRPDANLRVSEIRLRAELELLYRNLLEEFAQYQDFRDSQPSRQYSKSA